MKLRFRLARFDFRRFNPLILLMSPFQNFYKQFKALRVQSRDFAIMDRMLRFDNKLEFEASLKVLQNQFNKFRLKCVSLDKYHSYMNEMTEEFTVSDLKYRSNLNLIKQKYYQN